MLCPIGDFLSVTVNSLLTRFSLSKSYLILIDFMVTEYSSVNFTGGLLLSFQVLWRRCYFQAIALNTSEFVPVFTFDCNFQSSTLQFHTREWSKHNLGTGLWLLRQSFLSSVNQIVIEYYTFILLSKKCWVVFECTN